MKATLLLQRSLQGTEGTSRSKTWSLLVQCLRTTRNTHILAVNLHMIWPLLGVYLTKQASGVPDWNLLPQNHCLFQLVIVSTTLALQISSPGAETMAKPGHLLKL